MHRYITWAVIMVSAGPSLLAQQEPPEEAFSRSSRDLAFQIPSGFELVSQDRRYLKPDTHEAPRFQRLWQHGSDGIMINVVVVPDAAWKTKNAKEILADGLVVADPKLKIVSKRDYQLDGAPALSITCFYDNPGGSSQRMDCYLVKPNMFIVAYVSSQPSSWDTPVSKAFFQTIHLRPKK
jgi:hypothetical protein